MTASAPATERERIPFMLAIGASGGEGLGDIQALLAALPAGLAARSVTLPTKDVHVYPPPG